VVLLSLLTRLTSRGMVLSIYFSLSSNLKGAVKPKQRLARQDQLVPVCS